MSLQIPSLATLRDRAWQAFRREMPGTDALVQPNTLSVHGRVLALVLRPVYERLAWLYDQCFARTADREHLVTRHGYDYGIVPSPAARAVGQVVTTGTPLAVYPAGIRLISGSDLYVTTAAATASSGGVVTLPVRAEVPGLAGNRIAGEAMLVADPGLYPSLGPDADVGPAGIGGGAEAEGTESLRARILARKRQPPKGGATTDYEQWAREVSGVANAWAAPAAYGPGTVVVFVTFEGRTNLIPTSGDLAAVQAHLAGLRRIAAEIVVVAPAPVTLNVTLSIVPDTAETRAATVAALAAVMAPERPPDARTGSGGRVRPGRPNAPFVLSRSWLSEAVSAVVGEDRHRISSPNSDRTYVDGQMPVLGTVTFTPAG